ncbi:hypothetical protein CAZ19_31150 [Pseudomonas aeruginosa]|nr:hypothetical protein CEK59_31115 [Pseudomonas aeruginosa]KSN18653.1 hypothetical protein APA83_17330 [Pseudomonas aeruginosa]OTH03229.1 hypothetical protein CAY85_28560 [Pseudomonas aeruginosa]OTH42265.1 hypothetical protein CAY90_28700 [Pseudomonas aeruginosa]OTH47131.1 hypothetical protein CAZ13_29675 [Pseudomonas aeruginosa]
MFFYTILATALPMLDGFLVSCLGIEYTFGTILVSCNVFDFIHFSAIVGTLAFTVVATFL